MIHLLGPRRNLSTGPLLCGLRDKILFESDLKKRPSMKTIKEKDLPLNTPTLGQRYERDQNTPFYSAHRHQGYYLTKTGTWRDQFDGVTTTEVIIKGWEALVEETKLWLQERRDRPHFVPQLFPGDTRKDHTFDEENFKRWGVTTDSTWGEGYTQASCERLPNNKLLFTGNLSTRVPQDGRIKKAGYARISCGQKYRSFGRFLDLELYNYSGLYLRVRGDGRTYNIGLHCPGNRDMTWNDMWHYPLHTRGGPYWQETRIPWSKFYFASKGFIQDTQFRVHLEHFTRLGITLNDNIDGPFKLEVDEIGVYCDNQTEDIAYESYVMPDPFFLF